MKSNNIDSYYGDKLQNQFTAYVERALRNNRISYYRKYKSYLNSELSIGSEDELNLHIHDTVDMTDLINSNSPLHPDSLRDEGLAEELRNISERDLSIIRLRIQYGCSYKVIGARLGMTEEAVRVRYFRAINKIREHLKGKQK